MKKNILKFVKPSFWKSSYFKTFILYSAFLVAVVMFYSFLLTNYMNRNLEKEIYKSNQALLAQVQIFSDTYLIEKTYSLLSEKFLDISKDKSINDFFFGKSNMGPVFPLYKSLLDILVNNKHIDSIYICRKSDNTVISSREGLIYSYNMAMEDLTAINGKLIKKTLTSPENRSWISPEENAEGSFLKPVISLAQTIPIISTAEQRLGCIIININEEDFFNSVNNVSGTSSGELMIIDSQGRLFAHNDSVKLYTSAQFAVDIHKLLTGNEGFTTFNHDGNYLGITWIKSSVNDWKFVSVVPIQVINRPLIIIRQISLFTLCIIILISLLGFKFITSWVYKPLNMLVKATKERFNIVDSSNELHIINDVITTLSVQVEELKATIHKNEGLIENKTALEILNGNHANDNEIHNRLKLIGKPFIFSRCSIVILEMNKNVFLTLPVDKREYITYKMLELVKTHFNRECVSISLCNPFHRIVSIVNHESHLSYLLDFDILLQHLKEEMGLACNIAISDPAASLSEISPIYDAACNYLKYGFIYNYGNIFTHKHISKFEACEASADSILLDNLEFMLKSLKFTDLKNEISGNILLIREKGYSYNYTQNILLQIINMLCRVSRELDIQTDKFDKKRLLDQFNTIELLDDYVNWIYKLIDVYSNYVALRNSSIDMEYVSKIKEYISSNIDNQISLNSVADHFKMNTSYLSTFFKEASGMNFSDFVVNKKLEKAAELLLSPNALDINKIADIIGYSNTTYFTKLFKEKYGMTPLQYRKKYI